MRLWSRNREHAHLSEAVERSLEHGLAEKLVDFAPLAFQLTARLHAATDADGHAADPLACLEESLSQGDAYVPPRALDR